MYGLVDVASGDLCWVGDAPSILDAVKAAESQAEADREGKADYEWDCELRDASGEVVATTHNVYQLRRIGS